MHPILSGFDWFRAWRRFVPRPRLGIWIIAIGCIASESGSRGAAPPALPGVDTRWKYYTSPHFELYSHRDSDASRELLHNLEILRGLTLERMKLAERAHLAITVYCFDSPKDFQRYLPESMQGMGSIAGFYLKSFDRGTIVVAPESDPDALRETIFHEYVHHLFRVAEERPPMWFNEGTADLLGGMEVNRNDVLIGTPMEGRAVDLRRNELLPLDQLFAADQSSPLFRNDHHTGIFYAESWALLHFLEFGDSGFSKDAVERFLHVASNPESVASVDLRNFFRSCFGCDYPEMMRRLKLYVNSGSYRAARYPMPKVDKASSYASRSATVDEITLRLGELAMRVNHSGAGKLILLNAAGLPAHEARIMEALGSEAAFEDDAVEAEQWWEKAIAAGSSNPAIYRELALMEGRKWFGHFDSSQRVPDDVIERMRSRLLRSIEAEPAQLASYEMLMWVEAYAHKPNAKNINLVIGHLPSMSDKRHTVLGLVMVMQGIGRGAEAQLMLNHLQTQSLASWDAFAFEALKNRQAEIFPDLPVGAQHATTIEANEAALHPASSVRLPSVPLPDDL